MPNKLVYDVSEVAKLLGVSMACAYQMCRNPDFPAIRVSPRRIVIPVEGLNRWLEQHAGQRI